MAAKKNTQQQWFEAIVDTSLAVSTLDERTAELKMEFGAKVTQLPDWAEVEMLIAQLKASMDRLDAGLAYSIAPEPFDASHAAYKADQSRR